VLTASFGNIARLLLGDSSMLLELNEHRKQSMVDMKVDQLSSDVVKEYVELSSTAQEKDLLGAKIRGLIALAVAVTRHGDVIVHAGAALRHGATKEEIAEALRVVAAVNAGVRRSQLGTEQGFRANHEFNSDPLYHHGLSN
jgi:AhpD family alkylhydroperoxidase